jgi:hypothetical protein
VEPLRNILGFIYQGYCSDLFGSLADVLSARNTAMTKLSSIPDHQLIIARGLCKHHSMLEVANPIAVVGEDATAHDVRQSYSCPKCKAKGNNTYQIMYRGNLDAALDGAAVIHE